MLFPLYLNRIQFLVRSIVVSVLPVPVEAFSPYAAIGAYLLTAIYWIAYVALPRASDIGLSRGLSLGLCLFPGINLGFSIFLLFTRSDTYAFR
jgi:hypothetical protein